jgi:hypothetical protein
MRQHRTDILGLICGECGDAWFRSGWLGKSFMSGVDDAIDKDCRSYAFIRTLEGKTAFLFRAIRAVSYVGWQS